MKINPKKKTFWKIGIQNKTKLKNQKKKNNPKKKNILEIWYTK